MAMPQDLAGKLINFSYKGSYPADEALLKNGILSDHCFAVALPVYDVVGQVGGGKGRQIKRSSKLWSFSFLEYVGGYVTAAPLTTAVLTGPMTGCYLCKYTEGGKQFIAHVGTVDDSKSDGTIAAKKAWKAFVARRGISNVTGASPANLFTHAEIAAGMPSGSTAPPTVLGYFDAGGVGYAMAFAQVESNVKNMTLPGMLRILSVKAMPLLPWATIASTARFAD